MKKHTIKYNLGFTISGYDDTFTTYCGLTDRSIKNEDLFDYGLVPIEECTCKNCIKSYNNLIKNQNKAQ